MKETFVDILGIHIQEPVTIFTNLLISITCLALYLRLNINTSERYLKRYWRLFFLYFGINAGIGILAHGFKSYFAEQVFYYIWLAMNLASVPVTFYLLKANVENSKISDKVKRTLNVVIMIASIVFIAFTILMNNFIVVKVGALIAILSTIIVHYITYRKGFAGSGFIAFGFAFSVSALIIHGAKISISDWFNFKDISHVIMNISLVLIFIGVNKKLKASIEEEEGVSEEILFEKVKSN